MERSKGVRVVAEIPSTSSSPSARAVEQQIDFEEFYSIMTMLWLTLDINGDGQIDFEEFYSIMTMSRLTLNINRDGQIDFEEFYSIMTMPWLT